MKILSAQVRNFCSYENLDITFDKQSLTLISGPTGAGKSTICDIIPWILFGVTSKNGSVDEVIRWDTKEPTVGTLLLEYQGTPVRITRVRGKENDLYFTIGDGDKARGKDLKDTQALINSFLSIDAEKYLSASYFHEFSQTASFFASTAKVRRAISENLVDLSLAKHLTANATDYKKEISKELEDLNTKALLLKNTAQFVEQSLKSEEARAVDWQETKEQRLKMFQKKRDNFDAEIEAEILAEHEVYETTIAEIKADIKEIEEAIVPQTEFDLRRSVLTLRQQELDTQGVCTECGAPKNHASKMILVKDFNELDKDEKQQQNYLSQLKRLNYQLTQHTKALEPALEKIKSRENTYKDDIKRLTKEENPYTGAIEKNKDQLAALKKDIEEAYASVKEFSVELSDLQLLLDITKHFRSVCVKNTIMRLQESTNSLLGTYFDSALKVKFDVEEAEKLEVLIFKDGNSCSYTQLSKGQRQLLRMCFCISVMREVSNHNGFSVNCIFLDEFTDGLDTDFKVKAFYLLNSLKLEYSSIFVVEHNETMKEQFHHKLEVNLVNGSSQVEKT